MTTLSLSNFNGLIPRTGPANLDPTNAQIAVNTRLQSGEIKSWKGKTVEYQTIQEGVQTIFKLEGPSSEGAWAEWTVDTDVVFSPMADLKEHRFYYSEAGICKKANWTMAHDGLDGTPIPGNWLYLGVPRPNKAPHATATRTDTSPENTEERAYVYTYVSTFGDVKEESAPSDACDVTADIVGGKVVFDEFPVAPTEHYNITALRLYRAVIGSSEISYMLVDEFTVVKGEVVTSKRSLNGVRFEDGKYPDTRKTEQLGIVLESMYYEEPPEGLRGLVNMPNGMIAGFVGNQVWFCEPYLPHAWPSTYMLTTDAQIVGLGVYGNTLVVCTERQPFTIAGTHPAAMTQEKLPMLQPCVNKRSIAYDQYGVLYASSNGLVVIAGGQMDVFSRPLFTREGWLEYNPVVMVGSMYNNNYLCGYQQGNTSGMFVFARGDTPALIKVEFDPVCLFVERITGYVYGLSHADGIVYRLDASSTNLMGYTWKSKMFVYPRSVSFSCAKLDAEFDDKEVADMLNKQRQDIIDYNRTQAEKYKGQCLLGCLNDVPVNTWTVNGGVLLDVPEEAEVRYVQLTFYSDGKAIYTKDVENCVAFRLPAYNGYRWEVLMAGHLPIRAFQMATSMAELVGE